MSSNLNVLPKPSKFLLPWNKYIFKNSNVHGKQLFSLFSYSAKTHSDTSKMELFAKTVNVKDVNYFHKKFHLRYQTGFWILLRHKLETRLFFAKYEKILRFYSYSNALLVNSNFVSMYRCIFKLRMGPSI